MSLRFPDDEKNEFIQEPEIKQPEMFNIDATRATSIQEIGILFNALGVAVTEDFAKLHKLEHMIAWKEEDTKS